MPSLFFKVSLFLKDQIQNPNGRFALMTSGPVPHGTDVPGLIRYVGYSVCRWFTYSFEMNFKESINVNQKYVLSHICHGQCNVAMQQRQRIYPSPDSKRSDVPPLSRNTFCIHAKLLQL